MKKFIAILILIFTLQTPSWADDIRDFQIEGMSIGDSALDYFSKNEINEGAQFIYNSRKFYSYTNWDSSKFDEFDYVQLHFKKNDQNFIIYSITGYKKANFYDCKKEQEESKKIISKLFNEYSIRDYGERPDPAGKNLYVSKDIYFKLSSGDQVGIFCFDVNEKNAKKGQYDSFSVAIDLKEFQDFLSNEAYK